MKSMEKTHIWIYVAAPISIILLTFLDQYTKYLAIDRLKDHNPIILINHILEFRYLENKGMAFGLFSGRIPFFVFICIVFFILAIYFFVRIPKTKFYIPVILVEIVLTAGAAGNFIDRIWRGYVVDFIYFKLIDFPIFNVADIYVVLSCIVLVILIIFKYEDKDFKFLSLKIRKSKHG